MNTWLRQHVNALLDALRHLRRSPGSFSLNVLVVGIALALPFAGLTVLENVRPVSDQIAVERRYATRAVCGAGAADSPHCAGRG